MMILHTDGPHEVVQQRINVMKHWTRTSPIREFGTKANMLHAGGFRFNIWKLQQGLEISNII